jgi:YHS domain-containing protein
MTVRKGFFIVLRLILFIVSTVILYTILRFLIKGMSPSRKGANRSVEPEELVQDPCCQTYIPKRLAIRKTVAGREVYFCNQDCLHKYVKNSRSQRQ